MYDIRDPFARFLGLKVTDVTETGLITAAPVDENTCNIYSIAHGGFVYAVGHVTAALAAQLCLGRQTVVVDTSSQYLCALRPPMVKTEAFLVRAGRELLVYRTEIRDARGALCCIQTVTLKGVSYPEAPATDFCQTIFPAPADAPVNPITNVAHPRISPHFAGRCHIYNLGPREDGLYYAMELWPHLCNLYGALHGGALYTLADVAAGGTATFLLSKRPVTVASDIHFLRSARQGPVYAQSRLIRAGKQLLFYRIDLTDGSGEPVAMANFVLQSVNFAPVLPTAKDFKSKVFSSEE